MTKQKKDGVRINYLIQREIKEKLDDYCQDVKKSATLAVETILDGYLSVYMEEKEKIKKEEEEKNGQE